MRPYISEFRPVSISVEFQLGGKITGVYFVTLCKEECDKLGVNGWIKTSVRGNIYGKLQGPKPKVELVLSWLSNKGSPGSRIDDFIAYNYVYISKPEFRGFTIRF